MKELKDTLWKAADKLRGSLSAHQYKDVILGLVFLKYVSDAYDERREQIRTDALADGWSEAQIASIIDDREEYQGYGVFVVPPVARWTYLAQYAKGKPAEGLEPDRTIGELIVAAMDALMVANESLRGTLPRLYNNDNIDQRRLGELIDLFNSARFSRQGEHRARDLMGEVYEYFLGTFARAEGRRGGEFFTPRRWCGCSSRCWSRAKGGYTTRAAGRAGCSCRRTGSFASTTATRRTSRSSVKSRSRRRGGWRR